MFGAIVLPPKIVQVLDMYVNLYRHETRVILNLTVNLIIHSYSYDPYLPSEISFRAIEQKSIYQVQYTPYLDILDSHLPNSHNL